jgi:pimeloyl-ACP methyl ester carboxylesterase
MNNEQISDLGSPEDKFPKYKLECGSECMSRSIYKSLKSEEIIKALYDEQVSELNIEYEDIYVDTRFGKTHIIKTGNPYGKPVLLFHGGNSTTPYYLRGFLSLRGRYLIYAPDTMGHPGKSAQTVLSPKNLEYGEWASDIIGGLGYKQMICIGGSFGGGILAKLMCVSPDRISKAVMIVPSGICNVSTANILLKLGIPMVLYLITKSEKSLKKAILPMAVYESEIDESTLKMVRHTFNHVCVKAGMPSNVKADEIANYKAPTLLITGEKDILFPGEKVIARAREIMPDLTTHLMTGCGHMNMMSSDKHKNILEKIDKFLENEKNV